jgi:hypothetical protein
MFIHLSSVFSSFLIIYKKNSGVFRITFGLFTKLERVIRHCVAKTPAPNAAEKKTTKALSAIKNGRHQGHRLDKKQTFLRRGFSRRVTDRYMGTYTGLRRNVED